MPNLSNRFIYIFLHLLEYIKLVTNFNYLCGIMGNNLMLQAIGSETTQILRYQQLKTKKKIPSLSPIKDRLLGRNILALKQINEVPKVNRKQILGGSVG